MTFAFHSLCNNVFSSPTSNHPKISSNWRSISTKFPQFHNPISQSLRKSLSIVSSKSSEAEELSAPEDEWLNKLPEKKKPLYSHSLPCIEAWLKNLGFYQSKEDRALWLIEKPEWHAQLSLDVTDLYIRFAIGLTFVIFFFFFLMRILCFSIGFLIIYRLISFSD